MVHVSIQLLSHEIKQIKEQIRAVRQDAKQNPEIASRLKGLIIRYRREMRERARLVRDLVACFPVRQLFPVTVTYRDNKGHIDAFVVIDVMDLDGSIAGLEMDGSHVIHVTCANGTKVTPGQIGSRQEFA